MPPKKPTTYGDCVIASLSSLQNSHHTTGKPATGSKYNINYRLVQCEIIEQSGIENLLADLQLQKKNYVENPTSLNALRLNIITQVCLQNLNRLAVKLSGEGS